MHRAAIPFIVGVAVFPGLDFTPARGIGIAFIGVIMLAQISRGTRACHARLALPVHIFAYGTSAARLRARLRRFLAIGSLRLLFFTNVACLAVPALTLARRRGR